LVNAARFYGWLTKLLKNDFMEKYITPYEIFQLEKYGNIHIEHSNDLQAEEFENGFYQQEKQESEWHNEAPF
jgi:hypothetical protein